MNRRILRALILCTPFLAAVALPGAVTALVGATVRAIPPNYDVSAMHGNEAEGAIAINPTNPSNIVAVSALPDVVSAAPGLRARSCQL
jgi:hypothetical protein